MKPVIEKSGQEVAKIEKRTRGKDRSYWKSRIYRATYTRGGKRFETKNWCVRIQFAKRRKVFNLETPNQAAAADRAKSIDEYLRVAGWDAAIAKFTHSDETQKVRADADALTVGEYIEAVLEIAGSKQRTVNDYAQCFRRLLREASGFDESKKSLEKVNALKIDSISSHTIEAWKVKRERTAGGNALKERSARITANSIIRQARALFGKKISQKLPDDIRAIASNPFENVGLFTEDTSGKFKPSISAEKLIQASRELDAPQREAETESDFELRRQLYLAFVLVFAGGLRKSEADALEWSAFDFEAKRINIETTEFFKPKTEAAESSIQLDSETAAIIQGFRARFPNDRFVLRSKLKARAPGRHARYRASRTWLHLTRWLKEQGVTDQKPIHYCRKAITSYVANKFGIFAAQTHARHSTPQVTAKYYASGEAIAPGVGAMFEDAANDETIVDFSEAETLNSEVG